MNDIDAERCRCGPTPSQVPKPPPCLLPLQWLEVGNSPNYAMHHFRKVFWPRSSPHKKRRSSCLTPIHFAAKLVPPDHIFNHSTRMECKRCDVLEKQVQFLIAEMDGDTLDVKETESEKNSPTRKKNWLFAVVGNFYEKPSDLFLPVNPHPSIFALGYQGWMINHLID